MQKTKEKNQVASYAAIDAAIIAAAKAIVAANSANTTKSLALNSLYMEDMRSAVNTGIFHADGRIKSIVQNKTQRAVLLNCIYSFEAKLLNSTLKREVSEKGLVSHKLEISKDFDKKSYILPEKLNEAQKAYVSSILNITAFRGIIPPFVQEKETIDAETLRTKIEDLCKKHGFKIAAELKLTKI